MNFAVTLLIAAALALVNLWLAFRIIRVRYARKIANGTGGDPLLEARMRAQANFAENVPVALILMALVEWQAGAGLLLWAVGAALVIGRVLHPFGMDGGRLAPLRPVGILLTWGATLLLAIWAITIALGTVQPAAVPGAVHTIG